MRFLNFIKRALPHLLIALVLSLATITVLHTFNPMMDFLASQPSKILIFTTCAVGLAVAITAAADNEK